MLTFLSIKNFAIIEYSEINFSNGMSAITGETGSGKSILIDALNFVLGARLEKKKSHENGTEVNAIFDISNTPKALIWLEEYGIEIEQNELIIRRISKEGKSKSFINGSLVTVSQIKELSNIIISFYGQHAHHHLLKSNNQLERLDQFANHQDILSAVKNTFLKYQAAENTFQKLCEKEEQIINEQTLLQYQYDELSELSLKEGELEELEAEHKRLSNSDEHIQTCVSAIDILYEGDTNVIGLLDKLSNMVSELKSDNHASNAFDLIEQAKVYAKEAYQEITLSQESMNQDPERLNELDQRISLYFDVARKHQVQPKNLYEYYCDIETKLNTITQLSDEKLASEKALNEAISEYKSYSNKLTKSRFKHSKDFALAIEEKIKQLNIPQGKFKINLITDDNRISMNGFDQCEFEICFNPGQPFSKLSDVASGGELSRIGLAIQTIASEKIAPPVLVFDEVDVGISGGTAEVVGGLLNQLSDNAQVICITHQAQVAVQANQHLHITKSINKKNNTVSTVKVLTSKERIEEIARITGGVNLTDSTLKHAEAMYQLFH
ncbi:DNA repair protein RecN [Francisellaceae bacterium]|nr:DNA repair protein RecN [Francisellaceae bacterium]